MRSFPQQTKGEAVPAGAALRLRPAFGARGRRLLTEETALDRLEKARFNGHSLGRLGPYAEIKPF